MMTQSFGERHTLVFLDLEGGWGGSSRSLFHMVKSLDVSRWRPIVVLRKPGPAAEAYDRLNIEYLIEEKIPSFRPAERKNLISFCLFLWSLRFFPGVMRRMRKLVRETGCRAIHVNHESLALTGALLALNNDLPWSCHIRTELKPSVFARWVYKVIGTRATRIIFITEPVCDHFFAISNQPAKTTKFDVIYNICDPPSADVPIPAGMEDDSFLKVISLSNFSPNRGVDRVVEIADILKRRGESGIRFYMFGKSAHTSIGGRVHPYFQNLVDRVTAQGLQDVILFPGHVPTPDGALRAGDVLIKLTRESNPWGRDIMEALRAGIAVVSLGAFDRFVGADGGYISKDYAPDSIADYLVRLRDDPELRERVAIRNRAHSDGLFGEAVIAPKYDAVFTALVGSP